MSRDSSTFKEGYNRALDLVDGLGVDGGLPTESAMARELSVSRTTIRGILSSLDEAGIIAWSGRSKKVLRAPVRAEYFPVAETETMGDKLSSSFMEYILTGDLEPGAALHETELMKHFNVSSTVLREFLIRFSRFGLIEKERNRHWVLRGFTRDFAEELFEVREVFERRAFRRFLRLGRDSAEHHAVVGLRAAHEDVLANIDRDYLLFPRLDETLHRVWIDAHDNRFMLDFFELISLVFHYHYRWSRSDEKQRNHDAIYEHLKIIDAIDKGELERAETVFFRHLDQAKTTMIASAHWT